MEPSTCIFACRHPAWGGEGLCSTDDGAAPTCSCGAGFASRDALGQASCVPYRVLVTGYVVLAASSCLAMVLLGHHLAEYRHLSDEGRRSRKTVARLSVLLWGSVYAVGMVFIGIVLAGLGGRTGLNDAWIVQVLYLLLLPSATMCASMIAKFWVENLPSQFLPARSFAIKLREASEHKNIFFVLGCLNAGGVLTLGVGTIFIPAWPQLIADIAAVFGASGAVIVILFVAVQITRCVNETSANANPSGNRFYTKARRNVWKQALFMCGVYFALFCAVLAKYLTAFGRGTPVISWGVQASTCNIASVVFALSTKFEEPVAAKRRLTRMSRTMTLGGSAVSRRSSLLAVGTAGAQQLLRQLSSLQHHGQARRGSDHQAPVQPQPNRAHAYASGGQEGFPVERTDADTRHGNGRWAGTSTLGDARHSSRSLNTAKVLPTEGPSDA